VGWNPTGFPAWNRVSSAGAALELPILLCMGLFRDFLLAQVLTLID
jgi:hypothetical protein